MGKIKSLTRKKPLKRVKRLYILTPVNLTYTEKLSDKEYLAEIKAVKKYLKEGGRGWVYSVIINESKTRLLSYNPITK